MAARCLGHEGLGRFQNGSAFLLELFSASLHHLVVDRFLDPVLDKVFSNILFVFHARRAVSGRGCDYVPFLDNLGVIVGLFRGVRHLGPQQFAPGLVPIGIGELIRITLGDQRDFARPLFDRVGRRRTDTVAMNRNFTCRM